MGRWVTGFVASFPSYRFGKISNLWLLNGGRRLNQKAWIRKNSVEKVYHKLVWVFYQFMELDHNEVS